LRIGSVVVDCNDFERMVAFWREALHYVPREPSEGGWVVLRDPDGNDVNVSFQQVVDRIASRATRDGRALAAFVAFVLLVPTLLIAL